MSQTLRFAALPLPAPSSDHAETSPTLCDGVAAKRRPPRLARGTRADPPAREGTVLGNRYSLGPTLGAGSWGTVYKGRDQRTGETVAVKVESRQLQRLAGGSARFSRESTATLHFDHPGVVQVLDAGACEDGTQYLVMEYLEGRDLAEVLEQDGPPSTVRALEIAASIADALSAAHRAGVVHRDLKPGNVHVSRTGAVKVIDFGISKLRRAAPSRDLTNPGCVLGSPAYMAPEQANGCPNIDGRADIYALGGLLYELLTGEPPFRGATFVHVIEQHLHQPPVPPSELVPERRFPASLDQLVLRCLAKAPEDRYQSMGELFEALVRLLSLLDGAVAARVRRAATSQSRQLPAARTTAPTGPPPEPTTAKAIKRRKSRLASWLVAAASAVTAAGWLACAHTGPW